MIFHDNAVHPVFNRYFPNCNNSQVHQMVTTWARPSGCVLSFFVLHGAAGDGLRLLFLPAAEKGVFSRSAAFLFYTRTFTHPRHKKATAGFILPFVLILRACVHRARRFWCGFRLNAGRRRVEAAPCPAASRSGSGGVLPSRPAYLAQAVRDSRSVVACDSRLEKEKSG